MAFKTGKKPATYDSRDILYADVKASVNTLPTIPSPTVGWGYGTDFKGGPWPGWGMYGNGPCDDGSITDTTLYAYQGAGNCTWAGPGHEIMEADDNAKRPVAKFTCESMLDQYAKFLGLASYTDLNANNDQGCEVRAVNQYRATTGILDVNNVAHKIGVYVSVEPSNLTDLWEALYLFETVGIGISFPESAMNQFNAGKVWSVVPGAQIEGGHYIPLVGHPGKSTWTCITWGQRQIMTEQFITTYCDEAWAYISPERYNAVTGNTLQGYQDADLEKFISLV